MTDLRVMVGKNLRSVAFKAMQIPDGMIYDADPEGTMRGFLAVADLILPLLKLPIATMGDGTEPGWLKWQAAVRRVTGEG